MRIPTVKVIFDRKKKLSEGCPGIFEIRVAMNNKSYYISTGIKSRSSRIHDAEDADRVSIMRRNVEQYINMCLQKKSPISIQDIRSEALKVSEEENFMDFVNERAHARDVRPGTKRRYKSFINRIDEYGKFRSFSDITIESITAFDVWLHNRGNMEQTSIYTYHKIMKTFLNDAVMFKKIKRENNPYEVLKFSKGQPKKIAYLTEDEVKKMMRLPMPSKITEHARDMFLFQTFTALSYADLANFDIKDYDFDGKHYFASKNRIKSGVRYASQLPKPAIEIGKKYEWKLPVINNAKYNLALKMVGELCGFTKVLHSHMARHTFATLMLSHGAKIQNVSKAMGHTNLKQTLAYAEILAKDVRGDMDIMDKEFGQ